MDLAIDKTVDNDEPVDGDEITYTLTLVNNGPGDATGVIVVDELPIGLNYLSHTPVDETYDPNSGEWEVGSLNNGSNVFLNIIAEVASEESVTVIQNEASVSANQIDSEDVNNTAFVNIVIQKMDLEVSKVVDNEFPLEGEQVTFTITVSNNGPAIATGVIVEDALQTGLVYVSQESSVGFYMPIQGRWYLEEDLFSDEVETLRITVEIAEGTNGEEIPNEATAVGDQVDSNSANNTDSQSITVQNSPPIINSGDTTVSDSPINAIGSESTTFEVLFSDSNQPDVSVFTITFSIRYPDNVTSEDLVSGGDGDNGLTITDEGGGNYTASYSWNPPANQDVGLYDLQSEVNDGSDSAIDGFAANQDELEIQ